MEGIIKVDPAVLIQKADEFDGHRAQVMLIIEEMTAKVNSLNGSFEGEAAVAYQNKYAQLSDDIEYLNGRILEHAADLRVMAELAIDAGTIVETVVEGLPGDIIK